MQATIPFHASPPLVEKPGSATPPPTPEAIFREHAPRVYHLARRMLGNDADAEDVTQDVFLQVVRKLPTFRGEAAFSTWLYRVAVNAALAYRRKRALREDHRVADPLEDFQPDGSHRAPVRTWMSSPEQQVLDRERHQLIQAALARLPEAYRDVYVLADVEELPNARVAELLSLTVPAVANRLHRARLLMRKALAPYFEEPAA
jgi:RNA polymerase sigma-70 factor (ECF subfamily)